MNAATKIEAAVAPHVLVAINAVMSDLSREGIAKDRSNEQQRYKFRGIDDVYNALAPVLAKHRLIVKPRGLGRTCEERQSKNGGTLFFVNVSMEFDLISAVDGSRETAGPFYGEAMDSADKATNKAQSAAFKYFAMQQFCIPTEGDNDADATTHEVVARPEPKRAEPQKPTLAERADRLEATLKSVKTVTGAAEGVRPRHGALYADLDKADPDRLAEITGPLRNLLRRAFRQGASMIGQTFARLTVISEAGRQNQKRLWLCACECGRSTAVVTGALRNGATKSCGCLKRERSTIHGQYRTRTYRIWQAMLNRCLRPSHHSYARYGGRGVKVCPTWTDYRASWPTWVSAQADCLSTERTITAITNRETAAGRRAPLRMTRNTRRRVDYEYAGRGAR